MEAVRVWYDPINDKEEIIYGDHHFGFGGSEGGYCYAHQTFDCEETLTKEDWKEINNA